MPRFAKGGSRGYYTPRGIKMRRIRAISAAVCAVVLITSTAVGSEPISPDARDFAEAHATLAGRSLPLERITEYHCHDRDFPLIRCFETEAESLADQGIDPRESPSSGLTDSVELSASGAQALSSTLYTIFYRDWFHGGPSYGAYGNISSLSSIGWDNQISSFRLYNGARPRWFLGSFYSGGYSCWTGDQSILGSGWNDTISSVEAARFSC